MHKLVEHLQFACGMSMGYFFITAMLAIIHSEKNSKYSEEDLPIFCLAAAAVGAVGVDAGAAGDAVGVVGADAGAVGADENVGSDAGVAVADEDGDETASTSVVLPPPHLADSVSNHLPSPHQKQSPEQPSATAESFAFFLLSFEFSTSEILCAFDACSPLFE